MHFLLLKIKFLKLNNSLPGLDFRGERAYTPSYGGGFIMKNCSVCGCEIPIERLEALPHATECVEHSKEEKLVGYNDFYHKTAPELCVVNPKNKEDLRRAKRQYWRRR